MLRLVIPAKAGIHFPSNMDSGLRRNDGSVTPSPGDGAMADTSPQTVSTGEIFDLGYRPYEGARLGRWYATRSLAVQSLRTAFGLGRTARAKLAPMGLLAALTFPAMVASLFAAATGNAIQFVTHQQYFVTTCWVFALFCASQAPELVGGDQQYRVLALYFARALRRSDYVLAKLGALVAALMIIGVTPQIILLVGRAFASQNPVTVFRSDAHLLWPIFASAFLIAILFASLSLLVSCITRRRLLATPAIIGVLMLTGLAAGILVRVGGGSLRYTILVSPMLTAEAVTMWLFKAAVHPRSPIGRANLPGATYAMAALAITALASLLIYWRYKRIQP